MKKTSAPSSPGSSSSKRRIRFRNSSEGKSPVVSEEAQRFLDDGLAPPPVAEKPARRVIKRKPGTVSVNYFTSDTQAAIVEFQQESTLEGKNKIFTERIFPAFAALVENLINVYGFHVQSESKEDLRNECIEFLFTTVGKFNADKGSKAFSYFNVIAKHWLIVKNKQNSKRVSSHVSIDFLMSRSKSSSSTKEFGTSLRDFHDMEKIERSMVSPTPEDLMILSEHDGWLSRVVLRLQESPKNSIEADILRAIQVLASNLDDIDLLNKRAVLLYLRELTGYNSKQLSSALASIKKSYRAFRAEELNGGGTPGSAPVLVSSPDLRG